MRTRLALAGLFLAAACGLSGNAAAFPAPQKKKADPPPAARRFVKLPGGETFRLVPREQLRVTGKGTRTLTIPRHAAGLMAAIPTPPPACDWSLGGKVDMPVLGNDRKGDCYYVAPLHLFQAVVASSRGTSVAFDANKVIARYATLSRGDNGLSDAEVLGRNHDGEIYKGMVGPNGPYKVLDHMLVSAKDEQAVKLAIHRFGGVLYTAALSDSWLSDAKPGATWDRGTPDPRNGHAMYLSGYATTYYQDETWGFRPCVRLTQAGLESCDPEVIAVFTTSNYDPKTGRSAAGFTYDEDASLWASLGGRTLPPDPFPKPPPGPTPPVPVPPVPVPPAPAGGWSGTIVIANGVVASVTPGAPPAAADVVARLKAEHAAGRYGATDWATILKIVQTILAMFGH